MKYMGSKARISEKIKPIILSERKIGQYYIEPFCGGCNMLDKIPGKRIANDNNRYLIAMFQSLCQGKEFPRIIERDLYSAVRSSFRANDHKYSDDYIGWIGFMASFNGRFFDGGYSGHNVRGRDYITEQINNTLNQIDALSSVVWCSGDYSEIDLPEQSIIYCDPPYYGTKQYSTSANFDYDRFWNWCRKMKHLGHKVFVSEYQAPEDFRCIWEMPIKNSLNQTKTINVVEKLFV